MIDGDFAHHPYKPLYDVFKYADYDNHNYSVIQDFSVTDIIKGR